MTSRHNFVMKEIVANHVLFVCIEQCLSLRSVSYLYFVFLVCPSYLCVCQFFSCEFNIVTTMKRGSECFCRLFIIRTFQNQCYIMQSIS